MCCLHSFRKISNLSLYCVESLYQGNPPIINNWIYWYEINPSGFKNASSIVCSDVMCCWKCCGQNFTESLLTHTSEITCHHLLRVQFTTLTLVVTLGAPAFTTNVFLLSTQVKSAAVNHSESRSCSFCHYCKHDYSKVPWINGMAEYNVNS